MPTIAKLALASSLVAFVSCANNDENYDTASGYDTSDPYGVPSSDGYESAPYQQVNPPAANNPTYSNAAYESNTPSIPVTPPAASIPASPPAIASTHTVVKGDTLWGLSKQFGVSAASIRSANSMTSGDDNIRLGQTINIPAP